MKHSEEFAVCVFTIGVNTIGFFSNFWWLGLIFMMASYLLWHDEFLGGDGDE